MASVYYDKYDFNCQQVLESKLISHKNNHAGFSGRSFEIKPFNQEDF